MDEDDHPFQADRSNFKTQEDVMNRMRYKILVLLRENHSNLPWRKIVGRESHDMIEEVLFWGMATYLIHVDCDIEGIGEHLLDEPLDKPLALTKREVVELMQRALVFGLHCAAPYLKALHRELDKDDYFGDF